MKTFVKPLFCCVFLLFCCSVLSAEKDFHLIKKSIRQHDYAKAHALLLPLAEANNSDAQIMLGNLYMNGLSVSKDHRQAFKWFAKSAKLNNKKAQYNLGNMYERGWGVKKNIKTAKTWFRKSANNGFHMARKKLSMLSKRNSNQFINTSEPRKLSLIFRDAVTRGNYKKTDLALKNNVDINGIDNNKRTALMDAVDRGNLNIVELLLRKNADTNISDPFHETALHHAIKRKNILVVKALLIAGASTKKSDNSSNTPLHKSVLSNQLSLVSLLIKHHADINAINKKGDTALDLAVSLHYEKIASLLKSNGAIQSTTLKKVNRVSLATLVKKSDSANPVYSDWSPLMITIWRSQTSASLKILRSAKAQINYSAKDGNTALLLAIKKSQEELAIQLIRKGSRLTSNNQNESALLLASTLGLNRFIQHVTWQKKEINQQDNNGNTPLMRAISNQKTAVVKSLLKIKADATITNDLGQNALHIAAKHMQKEALLALVKTNININSQPKNKRTALWYAIDNQWKEGFDILLRYKAKTNLKGSTGLTALALAAKRSFLYALKKLPNKSSHNDESNNKDTPLLLAASNGCLACSRYLLRIHADVNHQNLQGESALTLSIKNVHMKVTQLLLENGANTLLRNKYKENARSLAKKSGNPLLIEMLDKHSEEKKLFNDFFQ